MKYVEAAIILSTALCAMSFYSVAWSQRASNNAEFAVSPKGDSLVFSGNGNGGSDLYLLDLKELRVRRITNSNLIEGTPDFSPDGKQIVFSGSKNKNDSHIYVCMVNGAGVTQLTKDSNVLDSMPSLMPGNKTLIFVRAHSFRPYSFGGFTWDDWDLYKMNLDGSYIQRLTQFHARGISKPYVSLDGKTVVCSPQFPGYVKSNPEIFLVDIQGHNKPVQITHNNATDTDPAFSSDGKRIVFISDRQQKYDYAVWQMNRDGTQAVQITHNNSYNRTPQFRPKTKQILFLCMKQQFNVWELWRVDTDGKNLRRIAGSDLFDNPLQWKP